MLMWKLWRKQLCSSLETQKTVYQPLGAETLNTPIGRALGIGAGSEVRSPMAIAVIGGLMTSTKLTLVVVPVIFTYVDHLHR
ncbi:MAG: efflux RND transporter permease subunit [Stigonema ocellatum SAG 48.90 = DSM 106950]|nr:efflux RND transporter permease subunit [Stigonema ocellatum SAG 48.90 = DSM 106950]